MKRIASLCCSAVLVLSAAGPVVSGLPAAAQDHRDHRGQYQNGNRGQYDNGLRNSHAYDDQYDRNRYNGNDRYHEDYARSRGGIGPGKGALIGAGGGALLGGLLGGGLKGALIGGGVGAGGGAIVGKIHQDNQRNDYRDYRDGYHR